MSAKVPSGEAVLRALFWKLFLRGRALARGRGKEGTVRNSTGMLMMQFAFYLLFGFLMCSAAPVSDAISFSLLLHGTTLFLVIFQMVMTAGTVLFNKEEAEILLHRPVLPRELLRAKVTVMCGYSVMLSAALNLPGTIAALSIHGVHWWYPIVHFCSMCLLVLFSAGTLVIVYQACLRWFGRERLDGMMTTMQTLLTVVLVFASQSFRIMNRFQAGNYLHSPWIFLAPPMWFASLDVVLATIYRSPLFLAGATTAVVLSLYLAWLGTTRLAAIYGEGLVLMNETGAAPSSGKTGGRWLRRIADTAPFSWWLRNPVERAGFLLAGAYFFRDRETKLRLYPTMAQVMAMPLFMVVAARGGWGVAFAGVYMGWLPLMAMQVFEYSEQWRAAEVFQFTPLGRWQPVFHGVRKAALTLFALPALALVTVLVLAFGRTGPLMLYLIPGLIAVPVWSLVPGVTGPWLPLSKTFDTQAQSTRSCVIMPGMLAIAGLIAAATWYSLRGGWYQLFLAGEVLVAVCAYAVMRILIANAGEWEDA